MFHRLLERTFPVFLWILIFYQLTFHAKLICDWVLMAQRRRRQRVAPGFSERSVSDSAKGSHRDALLLNKTSSLPLPLLALKLNHFP